MSFSDFASPAFYENPYPLYQELRAEGDFVSLLPHMWMTGRYHVAEKLLRDKRLGRAHDEYVRQRYGEERQHEPIFEWIYQIVVMTNPPHHTRLRSLMMQAFNANQAKEFK